MDIASTLLEHGAAINAESKAKFTPLHLSAQKGHYDMTNLLIEHGADPNHKSKASFNRNDRKKISLLIYLKIKASCFAFSRCRTD